MSCSPQEAACFSRLQLMGLAWQLAAREGARQASCLTGKLQPTGGYRAPAGCSRLARLSWG